MAKRFTDTNKYKKPFIRGLQGAYKLLWDYLYHDCDHAGIWIVDFDIAQIYVGQDMPVNKEVALKEFNNGEDRIIEFEDGKKWFIPSFVEFQYGELNMQNRTHNSVIKILRKYNLINKVRLSPLQGAKDTDTDKDKVKDKDKEKCLAKDSGLTVEMVVSEFKSHKDLKVADPDYYFNRVIEWSNSNDARRIDWLAQTSGIARSDLAQNKLKTIKGVYIK